MNKIILNNYYWKVPNQIVDSTCASIKPNRHTKTPLRALSLCLACQLKQWLKFQHRGFTISQGDLELQSLCVFFFHKLYYLYIGAVTPILSVFILDAMTVVEKWTTH